ncbi:unnamed protein product [Polarella glacialis]|uniref:C3H1-type domain-containing protein n=1 Tax=Polarella glacialis TaxID=89957 RepID=A0A813FY90_POLGL|nr:unnamed protein product [Polarella glacialis]
MSLQEDPAQVFCTPTFFKKASPDHWSQSKAGQSEFFEGYPSKASPDLNLELSGSADAPGDHDGGSRMQQQSPSTPFWKPDAVPVPVPVTVREAFEAFHPGIAQVQSSLGSTGHPELCRRPCIYFAAGNCANGSGCGYCHLPHQSRPSHLDRHSRDALQSLSRLEGLMLILPLVRARFENAGLEDKASELLLQLHQSAATCVAASPYINNHNNSSLYNNNNNSITAAAQRKKLANNLRKMSASSIFGMASRFKVDEELPGEAGISLARSLAMLRISLASTQQQPQKEQQQQPQQQQQSASPSANKIHW